MTVALIAYYLGPRLGIGQYLDRLLPPLIESLTDKGLSVKIFSSPNAQKNTPALQRLSDHIEVVPQLDYAPSKRYVWLATQFRQFCKQRGIKSLVWLSNPVSFPWHPATISVIHDVNEWKAKEKYGSKLKTVLRSLIYLDASIWFSKTIIAISQATANDLLYFRPLTQLRRKLKVISNGADSSLSNLPAIGIPTNGHPFLLSVGRIDPAAKRLPAAVALVRALRERSGQPWELQLVGGMNKSTQAEGEAFLKTVESLDWVHYQGHVEDQALAQWYRQAAAVVYLSDSEGFGLPIAEATSFHKWVIVSAANQAAREAGAGSIIPIDSEQPAAAADQVLQQLANPKQPQTKQVLPTWKAAAKGYTAEILALQSASIRGQMRANTTTWNRSFR